MKEEYVLCSVDNDWFGFFDNPCCIDTEGPGGLLLMANDLGSAKKRLFDDVFEMLEMATLKPDDFELGPGHFDECWIKTLEPMEPGEPWADGTLPSPDDCDVFRFGYSNWYGYVPKQPVYVLRYSGDDLEGVIKHWNDAGLRAVVD